MACATEADCTRVPWCRIAGKCCAVTRNPRIRFTVYGQAASKANSRQLVLLRGKPASIKSEAALMFEADMLRQIPPKLRVMLTGDCAVRMRIFYRDRRSDLDESIVLDCLQSQYKNITDPRGVTSKVLLRRGVVINDRQFKAKHIYHGIDKQNPRIELVVWQMKGSGDD